MRIIWREDFEYVDVMGRPMRSSPYFPNNSGDLLLYKIMAMPRQKPISMQDACLLASIENGRLYRDHGGLSKSFLNFITLWVEWISSQGYHIELTGDEFEMENELELAC